METHQAPNPLAPLEALFEKWHTEAMREVATALYQELVMNELPQPSLPQPAPDAARLAIAQIHRLMGLFGGTTVYIPSGYAAKSSAIAKQIVAEFNGRNFDNLARKYHLSNMRVRQILNEHKKIEVKKRTTATR